MDTFSLSQLTQWVQNVINNEFSRPVWIQAEISELRESGGHCYLELVEKDKSTDSIQAKCRATIWSNIYRMLKPYFETSTGQVLRSGMSVLVSVSVEFHALYGFSLNIKDIEPAFTIGDLAARRIQIIRQLESEGIVDMNKQLPFPVLPQRIAVISSASAAGYDDFSNQLTHNSQGFVFYTHLFPAIMQGEQAEASIIQALEKIYSYSDLFDVVVVIRGGGAVTDLMCFDSYNMAVNFAQFPLPVVAGIGHQRDVSVVDLVVHTSVKTPTAVAELLVSAMEGALLDAESVMFNIRTCVDKQLDAGLRKIDQLGYRIREGLRGQVSKRRLDLEKKRGQLRSVLKIKLLSEQNKLQMFEKTIEMHSPWVLLKHGYTLSTINGKRIHSVHQVVSGNMIKTYLLDGDIDSVVGNVSTHSVRDSAG